jgi:hypothetical protein
MLASFSEGYEKLIADHLEAKKETNLVYVFIGQTEQLLKIRPK